MRKRLLQYVEKLPHLRSLDIATTLADFQYIDPIGLAQTFADEALHTCLTLQELQMRGRWNLKAYCGSLEQ